MRVIPTCLNQWFPRINCQNTARRVDLRCNCDAKAHRLSRRDPQRRSEKQQRDRDACSLARQNLVTRQCEQLQDTAARRLLRTDSVAREQEQQQDTAAK